MSIISENIKLYNPFNNSYLLRSSFFRLLLLFYPVILAVFYKADIVPGFSIHSAYILLSILCFCIYMIFLGETVSIIQLEILSKPLSFCLPHHDKISYKIILSTGILANIILCSIFIILPHPDGLKGVLYFITILAAGLASYLLSVCITFKTQSGQKGGFTIYIFSIVYPLQIFILCGAKVTFSVDLFLFFCSLPLVLLLITILIVVQKTLTHQDFKRKYSLKNYTTVIDIMNLKKMRERNNSLAVNRLSAREIKKDPTEKLFLKIIKTFSFFNTSRAIALDIYSMLDRTYTLINSRNKVATLISSIFLPTIFVFLGGYDIEINKTIIIFDCNPLISFMTSFILCSIVSSIFTSPPHNLFLPKGRSFQFRSKMGGWLINPLLATVWTLLIILLSRITAALMPDIIIMGHAFKYKPLETSTILWPLIIFPIIAKAAYSHRGRGNLTGYFLYFFIFLALSISGILSINSSYWQESFTLAIIISNSLFIISNARYWFKRDISIFN